MKKTKVFSVHADKVKSKRTRQPSLGNSLIEVTIYS